MLPQTPLKQKKGPPPHEREHEKHAHSPCPPVMKHGSDASAPHLFRKSTQQPRDHLGSLAENWNSPSSSYVVFVTGDEPASNLSTIAKVDQQRAGKRYLIPVSSPICALEHLPKNASEIRLLLYQAQHCSGGVNVH